MEFEIPTTHYHLVNGERVPNPNPTAVEVYQLREHWNEVISKQREEMGLPVDPRTEWNHPYPYATPKP